MTLEKLTVRSQEALQEAQQSAARLGHPDTSPDHLLLALLTQEGGLAPILLQRIGVDVSRLRSRLEDVLERRSRVQGGAAPHINERLRLLLEMAEAKAGEFHDDFVSVEHLLLALLEENGVPAELLRQAGVSPGKVLEALRAIRGSQRVVSQDPESTFQAIEKYARNLTEQARRGKLDPVIGRDEEIRRVVQVLSRRTKNNPVLIGDPGVGKTAIVEG